MKVRPEIKTVVNSLKSFKDWSAKIEESVVIADRLYLSHPSKINIGYYKGWPSLVYMYKDRKEIKLEWAEKRALKKVLKVIAKKEFKKYKENIKEKRDNILKDIEKSLK